MATNITSIVEGPVKNYILTYTNCSLTHEQIIEHLFYFVEHMCTLPIPTYFKFIRVCRTDIYLRILVQYEHEFICLNPNHFDIVNPTNPTELFTPEIHKVRSFSDVLHFMNRRDNVLDLGFFLPTDNIIGNPNKGVQTRYELAEEARWAYNYPSYSFVNVPDIIKNWVTTNLGGYRHARPWRPRSLIVEGVSRTGKSHWARSLGKHNYLVHHTNLNPKIYSNDAEYNVIDDVPPQSFNHWRLLLGCKRDQRYYLKYGRSMKIAGGIPSIVLCKGSSYTEFLGLKKNKDLKDWVMMNATFVHIETPMYATSPGGVKDQT